MANSGTYSHYGRRALIGMPCAARHPQAGSAKPVPHASLGLRIRGARDQARRRKELPAATDHRGSSRKVRDAWLGGRCRRGFCATLSWRVPGGLPPRAQNRAPCRSLTADRSEASHCPAPVAGERQLRPRSHDHGHAVHPFTALPRTACPRSSSARVVRPHGRPAQRHFL